MLAGAETLGADINKQKGESPQENKEGIVSDKLPELTLTMSDDDLIKLTEKWEKIWRESKSKQEWEKQIEENEKYWLGKQFDAPMSAGRRAQVDNAIFESLETYLPQVTRRNPEPLVTLHSSEKSENQQEVDPAKEQYVQKVKNRLADIADQNKIRLKLKKAARHWAIFQLGIAKMGWDLDRDIPTARIVRPKRLILDPDATIEEDGYTGNRIGEYRKLEASTILGIMGEKATPDAKKAIEDLIKDDKATEIQFIEWWTPQYMCWKLGKTILYKTKNPHWNYDTEAIAENVDTYGNTTPATEEIKGINHLPSPQMPYRFLSVFNLGDQPMDKTSLIGQNLANQDRINKRAKQIDKHADKANGGAVVSLQRSGLTQPQAKNVVKAIRSGGAVLIPSGNPQDAVYFPQVPSLPVDIYNDLQDTRNRLKDIFGTRGSSASGIESEKTVRGKIINRGLDTDRIGGGVSEYLEQFADDLYNWFVQLLYVYDDAFQFLGGAVPPKIVVSVKEGSLLPKDSTTIANQATELAVAGKMSLIDMYKRLEYPNPEEMAANVWLEVNAPQLLYAKNPLVQQAIAMQQQAAAEAAQMESEKGERAHEQEIEKQNIKEEGETTRSILSAVPATPQA